MDLLDLIFGLSIAGIVVIVLIVIVFVLILGTVFLFIGLKVVDGRNMEFGAVFVTAFIMALTSWIPCIGCIIAWVVINSRHDTGFGKAIVAWLIAELIPYLIAGAVIFFVLLPILPLFF